ncbi:tape measure protein [Weissella cibaria]|uniref:tape measure protein n=1 Tax=Weissella cibaria TaxID=137591 RepID=UPI0034E8CC71
MAGKTLSATLSLMDGMSKVLNTINGSMHRAGAQMTAFKGKVEQPYNGGPGDKMQLQASKANAAFNTMKAGAEKTGSMFKSMLGSTIIGNGITAGIGVVTNGITEMMGELSASSATWQTFQGNMENLGKSKSQIAGVKSELQDFATKTIYSASDMSSTYAQLAAVGTKNTTQLVEGFGGLAAASEDPAQAMKTLSQQATQMAAKPKVQWEDFKLMLEQTPAGMAAVGKAMGMTTSELITSIQDGNVKTQDFFDAIAKTGGDPGGAFMKMATKYKTVGQAMDGFKETLTNKLQKPFDQFSQVGIKAISGITDKIGDINFDSIAAKLMAFASSIANAAKSMWNGFKDTGAISAVQSAISSIGGAFNHIKDAMAGIGGGDVFKALGTALGAITGTAAKAIGAVADAISKMDPATIQATAIGIGSFAGALATMAAGTKAVNSIKSLATNITGIAKSAVGIGEKLFGMAAGQAAVAASSAPAAAGEAAVGSAAGASAGQIMAMGVAILLIGAGIAVASAGMYILAQAAVLLASGGWGAVGALVALVAVIALFAVGAALLGPALAVAAPGMIAFGVAVTLVGVGILLAAGGITLLATQLPIIAIYGQMAGVNLMIIGAAMAIIGVGAYIAGAGLIVFGAALIVGAAGMTAAALGGVLVAAALVLVGAAALIAGAGFIVLAAGLAATAAAIMAVAAAIQMLAGVVAGIFSAIVSTITSAMAQAVSAVQSGFQRAVAAVQNVGSELVSAGRNFVMGFVNGIKGAIGSAVDAAANMAKSAVGAAKKFLNIHSPSRVMRDEVGYYVGAGMAVGINNSASDVSRASTDMAQNAVDAASNVGGATIAGATVAANPGDILANGFMNAITALEALLSRMGALDGSMVGVNGDVGGIDGQGDKNPYSGNKPQPKTSGNGNGNGPVSVTFAEGSIQINTGGAELHGEDLVREIEDYLLKRHDANLGFAG